MEVALIGITEDALRGRIRAVMLHAARTDNGSGAGARDYVKGAAITTTMVRHNTLLR